MQTHAGLVLNKPHDSKKNIFQPMAIKNQKSELQKQQTKLSQLIITDTKTAADDRRQQD